MSTWKNPIEQFLNQTITVGQFVEDFLILWRKEMDSQKLPPEGNKILEKLRTAWMKKKISEDVYLRRKREIFETYIGRSSWNEADIIEKLFYEVEAYYADLENFDPKYNITEDQLREAAKEALDELNQLS